MTRRVLHHLQLVVQVGGRHLGLGRAGLQVAPVLAATGLAVGTTALLVVLAVMNGFQLGFVEDILEVGSYHLRVTSSTGAATPVSADTSQLTDLLTAIPSVTAVVPFAEVPALVSGRAGSGASRGLLLRVVPPDVRRRDPGFARHVEITAGSFDVAAPGSIVVGAELAAHLGVRPGDSLAVVTLSGLASVTAGAPLRPRQTELTVGGVFRSGLYQYDLGWAFVGPATMPLLANPAAATGVPRIYGVKLNNRFRDVAAEAAVRSALRKVGSAAEVESWRVFNRALFAALRVEKLMLMAILGLIFIVVAYNILQGLRRRVVERSAEIGLLRALGAPPWAVRGVFIWEGALLGLVGAAGGTALGLLLAHNIGGLFALLEAVANTALAVAARLPGAGGSGAPQDPVAIFSPTTFYLVEVPSRVVLAEVLLVASFAVTAPALAGLVAAARAARVAAATALRAE